MAGGYVLDPATGQPAVRTATGALLPLPMSADALSAAGLSPGMAGPPGTPEAPAPGPDMRVAGPGGGPMAQWGDEITYPSPEDQQAEQVASTRAALAPKAAPASHGMSPTATNPGWMPTGKGGPAAPKVGPKVDPSTLAQGQPPTARSGGEEQQDDEAAIRDQLMREAMQPKGGGGGPRGLGVAGETRKFTTAERAMDPALKAQATEAGLAADKYGEELAKSLNVRHEQAYQAQQSEFAARAGQMQAQQERYDAQQRELQNYQAKRDSLMKEAEQLKTPQMESYWGSKPMLARMASALSIALGGALQGLRGGTNPGLEMANQDIDRWIASQREQYQRAKGRVDDADNQYAKMVRAFGSENLAAEHMREQAWIVRDGMLKSYAEHIGTPSALEAYNAAMLQSEAQKAELQARASQGAQVEIEQKLSMQGGGGGARPKTFREALAYTAGGLKDAREIANGGKANPGRAIDSGKTDSLAAALDTVQAANEIQGHIKALGYADDDTDDPRSGAIDYVTKNIPGTDTRRRGQDLDQATFALARGAQQFLGKSDNDAALAERQASGLGGSGRQREQAAQRLKQKAISKAKLELAAMTPDQRNAFLQALAPDQRSMVQSIFSDDQRPASTERPVQAR
jgi:hypothetical protein